MALMRIVIDWVLILMSSYLAIRAVDRLLTGRNTSLGNYVIAVTWLFCVLPILFDYLIGLPKYRTIYWYAPFVEAMANDDVSIVYDGLILSSIIAIHFYCVSHFRKEDRAAALKWSTSLGECNPLLCLGMLLPLVHVVFSGLLPYLKIYGDPATRGMPEGSSVAVNAFLLIGLISAAIWFFGRSKRTGIHIMTFIVYSGALAWISGKRFMIALMLMVYLFFMLSVEVSEANRRKIRLLIPMGLLCLAAFSAFYLIGIRPLSDTSFDSVYEMLRVDFGRDDVTKYVIHHELFLGDHILQFPGQSFLSTFLVFVPRFLWAAKPYQHFQYLTSSILNLPIPLLPAGTTPSWWEMCIANFSYLGLIAAPLLLVGFIALADKAKAVSIRGTLLILLVALLTQSVDAYISLIILLFIQQGFALFISRRKPHEQITERAYRAKRAWDYGR